MSSEFPAYKIDELLDLPFPAVFNMAKMAGHIKRMRFEPLRMIMSGLGKAAGEKKPLGMKLTAGGAIPPGFAKVKRNGR